MIVRISRRELYAPCFAAFVAGCVVSCTFFEWMIATGRVN